jgi:hypothetical protein
MEIIGAHYNLDMGKAVAKQGWPTGFSTVWLRTKMLAYTRDITVERSYNDVRVTWPSLSHL